MAYARTLGAGCAQRGCYPMITIAKMCRPLDDPHAVHWFTNRCAEAQMVRDWYWRVWNEPNSERSGMGSERV